MTGPVVYAIEHVSAALFLSNAGNVLRWGPWAADVIHFQTEAHALAFLAKFPNVAGRVTPHAETSPRLAGPPLDQHGNPITIATLPVNPDGRVA